jgi:hypothetical protein
MIAAPAVAAMGRAGGDMKRMMAIAAVVLSAVAWAAPVHADSKAQRSAQGDCQRELSRRGYTVLSTRNYQQFKDGWSLELQGRDYKGRTTWGTCFVETRTGDVSLYGFGWGGSGNWGGNGGSGQTFTFYCASPDYKYRECQLPVDGRARLTKKKSDARCVEGRDWGQRRDRVWVDNGCRANFEVVRSGGGGNNGNSGQQQRAEVHCRNEAQRQGMVVNSVSPARLQGSYWEAIVYGARNGWKQSARCRYFPSNNRAEIRFNN